MPTTVGLLTFVRGGGWRPSRVTQQVAQRSPASAWESRDGSGVCRAAAVFSLFTGRRDVSATFWKKPRLSFSLTIGGHDRSASLQVEAFLTFGLLFNMKKKKRQLRRS